MAVRRNYLLEGLLLLLTSWTCVEGRFLAGKVVGTLQSPNDATTQSSETIQDDDDTEDPDVDNDGGRTTVDKDDADPDAIYPSTSCNHELAGVDDDAVMSALTHSGVNVLDAKAISAPLQALQHQKIFVAACLHNSAKILPHWTSELTRLLLALKTHGKHTSIFVSIYESGSTDGTKDYLERLETHLAYLNVAHRIVHNGTATRGHRQRIEFLADVRNRAIEPLRQATAEYDRVLWLSDNLFCADGVLQMLAHALPVAKGGLGADAVCGMDYLVWGGEGMCKFYDIWAAHDQTGQAFRSEMPVVRFGEDKLEAGQAFQAFSCWNAMVVFDADIFQKEQLLFRTSRDDLGECRVAETEFIFRDMWAIGRGKIAVSPLAASAYNQEDFEDCALQQQPTQFDKPQEISWLAAPKRVECCPLPKNHNDVDFKACFNETWNRFGGVVPRFTSSISEIVQNAKEKRHNANFLQVDSGPWHHA